MVELSTRRKILFALVCFCGAAFIAIIPAEIYIRHTSAYGYVTPDTLRLMTPDYEPAVFARQVIHPNAKAVIVNGEEKYRINSNGYRGVDFTPKKPSGVVRIMFYGGSSVFDAEALKDNDWPHRIGRILKGNGFANVEVINAGIPGYASSEAVGTLFTEGHRFSPDYLLLYDEWNDIKFFKSNQSLLRDLVRTDSVDPRTTYQNGLDRILCNVSQLYVRLRERYYTWKLNVGSEGRKPAGEYSADISEAALRQYRLNVETFVDLARNIGAVPILMLEARLVAPGNSSQIKSRINYDYVLLTHEGLCLAFDKADAIIYDVARKKGALVIDAARQLAGKGELFANESNVHLNEKGSEELATLVAGELSNVLQARGAGRQ